jgi:hypothetical protein
MNAPVGLEIKLPFFSKRCHDGRLTESAKQFLFLCSFPFVPRAVWPSAVPLLGGVTVNSPLDNGALTLSNGPHKHSHPALSIHLST